MHIITLLSVKYDFSALEYFCVKQKLDVVILMLEHEKFDKKGHPRVCSHPFSLIYLFERTQIDQGFNTGPQPS